LLGYRLALLQGRRDRHLAVDRGRDISRDQVAEFLEFGDADVLDTGTGCGRRPGFTTLTELISCSVRFAKSPAAARYFGFW